jgi:hypothetical protein
VLDWCAIVIENSSSVFRCRRSFSLLRSSPAAVKELVAVFGGCEEEEVVLRRWCFVSASWSSEREGE